MLRQIAILLCLLSYTLTSTLYLVFHVKEQRWSSQAQCIRSAVMAENSTSEKLVVVVAEDPAQTETMNNKHSNGTNILTNKSRIYL